MSGSLRRSPDPGPAPRCPTQREIFMRAGSETERKRRLEMASVFGHHGGETGTASVSAASTIPSLSASRFNCDACLK